MIRTTAESHLRKKTGEELQHWLRDQLRKQPFVTDPSMVQSQKMSAHGEDILMHDEVRRNLPVSFECKKAKSGFAPAYNALQQAVRQKADDNARRVYDVIKSFRDTGTPYSKIATHLNNLRVPTATGGKWYDSTVRRYNLRMNA